MFQAEIKQTDPVTVAYLPMRGPYSQMPEGFGTVYGWIESHGFTPVGMPAALYFTAPDEVPQDQAAWEIQAPIAGADADIPPDDSGVGAKQIGARTVASAMHKGPYETMAPTYEALMRWIGESGHVVSGPPEEVYYSDPNEVGPQDYLTEVRVPVTPA